MGLKGAGVNWLLGKGIWECFYSNGKADLRMINLSLRDDTKS